MREIKFAKREIKFRAWDKNSNKMIYPGEPIWTDEWDGNDYIRISQDGKPCVPYWDKRKFDYITEDVELMQFTGLLDKNGKEIYEGDIVEAAEDENLICEVIYDNERAGFILYFDLAPQDNLFEDSSTLEVIGNVFENKNLLK